MGIQTNKLDLVTFTYTFLPLLSVPVLVLFCESLHSEIDIKWAKIGLEVRLADERSTTDAFSSPLGWRLIKVLEVVCFFLMHLA